MGQREVDDMDDICYSVPIYILISNAMVLDRRDACI